MKKKARIRELEEKIAAINRAISSTTVVISRHEDTLRHRNDELQAAHRELALLRIPKQPKAGTVITFSRTMRPYASGSEVTYEYAALRVGDGWYTTGSTCPRYGFSWVSLLSFIRGKDGSRVIRHSDIVVVSTGKVIEVSR